MSAPPSITPNDSPDSGPPPLPASSGDRVPREVVPLEAKGVSGRSLASAPIPPILPEGRENDSVTWRQRLFGQSDPMGAIASLVFHVTLLLVLGFLVVIKQVGSDQASPLIGSFAKTHELVTDPLEYDIRQADMTQMIDSVAINASKPAEIPLTVDTLLGQGESPATGIAPLSAADLAVSIDALGGGLEGRNPDARADKVGAGTTGAGEDAVERGLQWLAAHQRTDGSWHFDHRKGPCGEMCRNWATVDNQHSSSTTAATALALAPFLGAGYTHVKGPHQQTVRDGLYYLTTQALVTPRGTDLGGGTMYGQGLVGIVFCESYAMTRDPALKALAQGTLDYIDYAQDKRGGGWRYSPGEPGDTTVTGWQLMALKSGQMAGLNVQTSTMYMVDHFLDSVQSDERSQYGYNDTKSGQTTTAIGLLCRMYLGWGREHSGLARGISHLYEWGPSEEDMYFNYYAAQVLHHTRGPRWEAWNEQMREFLVAEQSQSGHENGSWHFPMHAETGGRLYNTAMAIMTLEVYYRYMPLYGEVR